MQDWLSATTRSRPDGLALLTDSGAWTYRALDEQVALMCTRLLALGISPGDNVGVLMPNRAEYVFLIHALARIGAVLVPLNTRLTAAELAFQVDNARCGCLIYSAEMANKAAGLSVRGISIEHLPEETSAGAPGAGDLDAGPAVVFTSGATRQPEGEQITIGK